MTRRWPRILLALGLATVAIPQLAVAQPTTRDHRKPRQPPAPAPTPPRPPAPAAGPTQAPPELRVEKVKPRRGYVWVAGSWDWQNGQWTWIAGHYEREKRGKRWRSPKWESRGGGWIRVDGAWDDAPDYPTEAPPPPQREVSSTRARRGHVWVHGHWEWKDYNWVWVKGHYERFRPGKRYTAGRWEQKGDRWSWIDDQWVDAPGPSTAPPPPRAENPGTRAGFVWVRGTFEWQNGEYQWTPGHWERVKPNNRWNDGRWEQKGNTWVWVDGGWIEYPAYPTQAPPPPKPETSRPRRGYVWVSGRYEWRDGQWEWTAGHWERARAKKRWRDGRWEQRGDRWDWTDGGWDDDAPVSNWKFDSTGWTLLGHQEVAGRTDRDVIKIGKYNGRYDQLTMVVTDSDLELQEFTIVFGKDRKSTRL